MPRFGGAFFTLTGIRCHHRHHLVERQVVPWVLRSTIGHPSKLTVKGDHFKKGRMKADVSPHSALFAATPTHTAHSPYYWPEQHGV
jgi:hypothetical protein